MGKASRKLHKKTQKTQQKQGQQQIEQNARNRRKADAAKLERTNAELHAAHAKDDDKRDNDHVARFHQILASPHQRVQAHNHDRAKQQNHDAAHDGHGNGAKERADFSHKRQQD